MYAIVGPAVGVQRAVHGGVTAGAGAGQVVVLADGDLLPEGGLGLPPQPAQLLVAGLGVLTHLVDPRRGLRQNDGLHRGEGGRRRGHVEHVPGSTGRPVSSTEEDCIKTAVKSLSSSSAGTTSLKFLLLNLTSGSME